MAMQTDPVCNMQVDDQKAPAKSKHQGKDYYFCAADCKKKFDQKPEQYTQGKAKATASTGKR